VGGGKHPFINAETKAALDIRVIGVDIDIDELKAAPSGAYDEIVCCDVATLCLLDVADLVICQAVLEHVRNTQGAIASMARALRPGGRLVLFTPSRNAVFARLNLVLPETLKKSILFRIFPETRVGHGFVAFYDRCTPRDMAALGKGEGLVLLEKRTYYLSRYFAFFFPLYLMWRIWIVIFRAIASEQAAETFSMAFEKPRVATSNQPV
jgi:SAM-dependent methyltransferase